MGLLAGNRSTDQAQLEEWRRHSESIPTNTDRLRQHLHHLTGGSGDSEASSFDPVHLQRSLFVPTKIPLLSHRFATLASQICQSAPIFPKSGARSVVGASSLDPLVSLGRWLHLRFQPANPNRQQQSSNGSSMASKLHSQIRKSTADHHSHFIPKIQQLQVAT
ncbi:hypothetical protein ACLOJK_040805 [Asimina triloba]